MKRIGGILEGLLGKNLLAKNEMSIFDAWTQIVADSLSSSMLSGYTQKKAAINSKISKIENEKLYIEVQHPGWIQILSTHQKEILNVIHKRYEDMKIDDLVFVMFKQN